MNGAEFPLGLAIFAAFPLGWLASRIRSGKVRSLALPALILLPVVGLLVALAIAPSGEFGLAGTLAFGFFLFATPLAGWALLAILGYILGRANPFGLR